MSFASITRLWESDLNRAYMLRFADSVTTSTLIFAMPLMIYNATQSLAWSGLAFLIEWLPRLLSIPAAGPLVDVFSSRRMFIVANGGRLAVLAAAFVWLVVAPHAWMLLLGVAVINGMLAQLSFVAAEHLGVQVPTAKSHHQVQSVQVGIDQSVVVLGPMLAGVLLLAGNVGVLAGVAVMAGVSLYLAICLRPLLNSKPAEQKVSVIAGFKQGLRIIAGNKSLQFVVMGTTAFNFLLALITVTTPAIVKEQFHGTDGHVSLLWTAGAVVSIVAVAIASRIMTRTGIVILGFISGIAASIAAIVAGFASSFVLYAVCVAVFLAMDGVYAVYIRTARARIVPMEHFGVTVGVIVLFSLIPFPLVGGLIAVIPQAVLPFLICICAVVSLIVTFISYVRIDHAALAARPSERLATDE